MRIVRCNASPLKAPLNQPFRIATGQHTCLSNCLFTLTLENGVTGYGEAGVAPHITGETVEGTLRNLKVIAAKLEGLSVSEYTGISSWLGTIFYNNMSAVAAVEMAVFDALSRYMGVPLWRLFGDKPRKLVTDITVVAGSVDEAEESARAFYLRGFRTFKVKIGKEPEIDLARLLAVKKACPKGKIYLDANQGYTPQGILRFLRELEKAGIVPLVLEQPVSKMDWEGLKEVSRKSKVPVCADESCSGIADCLRIIKEKAVPCVNIKLMKTGIVRSREIASLCRANGLRMMIGAMMESSLATTASAHFAAGMGCFDFIDLDTSFFIRRGYDRNPYLGPSGVYDLSLVRQGIGIVPLQRAYAKKGGA